MNTSIDSVPVQHLHALWSQGEDFDLIDVRTLAEYRAGHASDAKLVPLDELRPETLTTQLRQPRAGHGRPLFLICKSGSRARQASERLKAAGYNNVALVEGGTEAWGKAGFPMRRCGNAIALERQVQIAIGVLLYSRCCLVSRSMSFSSPRLR